MLKWTSVLAFAVACCVGVTALAAEGKGRGKGERPSAESFFKAIAKDGDSFTLKQLQDSDIGKRMGERAEARFKVWDANKDGKVTLPELKAAFEARAKEGGGRKGKN